MEPADPPTLPPQMFTTSAQLLDLTDSTRSHTRAARPAAGRHPREPPDAD